MTILRHLRSFVASSRRITTSGEFLPEVDGVRFVAISLVLIHHIFERVIRRTKDVYSKLEGSVVEKWLSDGHLGHLGVLIFFTLSGYILARILVGRLSSAKQLDLRAYFLRRLTRLEPPYLLVMTGMFVLLSLSGVHGEYTNAFNKGADTLTSAWLFSVIYAYCLTFGVMPKLNPPAWSLEIEVQFYVLAPLLAWLLTCLPSRARFLSAIASMICWAVIISPLASNPHLKYTLLRFLPFFFGGFAVLEIQRLLSVTQASWREGIRPVFDVIAVFAFVGLLSREYWAPVWAQTWIEPVGTLLFVSGCLFGSVVRQLLSTPLLSMIGGMCYSIYLVHLAIIEIVVNFTVRIGLGYPFAIFISIQVLLLGSIVLMVSWVFFRLVERPCMDRNWPYKLWLFARRRIWQDSHLD